MWAACRALGQSKHEAIRLAAVKAAVCVHQGAEDQLCLQLARDARKAGTVPCMYSHLSQLLLVLDNAEVDVSALVQEISLDIRAHVLWAFGGQIEMIEIVCTAQRRKHCYYGSCQNC